MFTYGFYNSLNGDRKYSADQMGDLISSLVTDGIIQNGPNLFAVTPGLSLNVIVGPGLAWFNGTWSKNDKPLSIDLEVSDFLLPRIDCVVLEIDKRLESRKNSLKVLTGTPSSTGSKPLPFHDEYRNQYPLAYITVQPNAISINSEDIEIVVGTAQTPFATSILQTADIEILFQNWEGQFNTWFEGLKETLSDDAVGNILIQLDNKVNISDKASDNDIENLSDDKWITPLGVSKLSDEAYSAKIGDIVWSPYLKDDPRFIKCTGERIDTNIYSEVKEVDTLGYRIAPTNNVDDNLYLSGVLGESSYLENVCAANGHVIFGLKVSGSRSLILSYNAHTRIKITYYLPESYPNNEYLYPLVVCGYSKNYIIASSYEQLSTSDPLKPQLMLFSTDTLAPPSYTKRITLTGVDDYKFIEIGEYGQYTYALLTNSINTILLRSTDLFETYSSTTISGTVSKNPYTSSKPCYIKTFPRLIFRDGLLYLCNVNQVGSSKTHYISLYVSNNYGETFSLVKDLRAVNSSNQRVILRYYTFIDDEFYVYYYWTDGISFLKVNPYNGSIIKEIIGYSSNSTLEYIYTYYNGIFKDPTDDSKLIAVGKKLNDLSIISIVDKESLEILDSDITNDRFNKTARPTKASSVSGTLTLDGRYLIFSTSDSGYKGAGHKDEKGTPYRSIKVFSHYFDSYNPKYDYLRNYGLMGILIFDMKTKNFMYTADGLETKTVIMQGIGSSATQNIWVTNPVYVEYINPYPILDVVTGKFYVIRDSRTSSMDDGQITYKTIAEYDPSILLSPVLDENAYLKISNTIPESET